MATLATTNIKHASSSSNNIVLASDGTTYIPGHIVQVVSANTSSDASASSTTFVDSNLTATITPKSTSSKILILISQHTTQINPVSSVQAIYGGIRVVRTISSTSSTIHEPLANTGPFEVGGIGQVIGRTSYSIEDSPNTTSAVTYKTQIAAWNSSVGAFIAQYDATSGSAIDAKSYITLMEIAA